MTFKIQEKNVETNISFFNQKKSVFSEVVIHARTLHYCSVLLFFVTYKLGASSGNHTMHVVVNVHAIWNKNCTK